ncbi:MAG: CHAP domain-containing protein [Chitinophagales bacterium]|nr:CHAP domain-containing protein [Chitinophagales bacterium]
MLKKIIESLLAIVVVSVIVLILMYSSFQKTISSVNSEIGSPIDSFNNVKVYYNGLNYAESYGSHYHNDGYYYGKKWQCVEFVKRYYYDHFHHEMPNLYGHAKDFFDTTLVQGGINQERNLIQYWNGGNMRPKVNDLLVYNNGKYGHVAIIAAVNEDEIEVIQQNILFKPRETLPLTYSNGSYTIGEVHSPVGWLRKE